MKFVKFVRNCLSLMLSLILLMAFCSSSVIVNADENYILTGTAHVQNIGNVSGRSENGMLVLGTEGQSLRLEQICVSLLNNTGFDGGLQYRVHIQNNGWTDWTDQGNPAGTSGSSLRLEAVQFRLTGRLAVNYDVLYMAHIQDYGDSQGWVSNGVIAGTTGESKRIEEIKIKLALKNSNYQDANVTYRVHRQDYGWEVGWKSNGEVSGTTGEGKRLEAICLTVSATNKTGGVIYRTHVQDKGWMPWVDSGTVSGTQGSGKRLEAIEIELTGDLADMYDICYRVHVQGIGWLNWAHNGEMAGTGGLALRLEAIQIVLVAKGAQPADIVCGVSSATSSSSFDSSNMSALLSAGVYHGWITVGSDIRYLDGTHFMDGSVLINGVNFLFVNCALQRNANEVIGSVLYKTNNDGAIYRSVDGSRPLVALTFDDGPTSYTSDILDILDSNNAVATFFVCGSLAAARPGLIQRENSLGCEIGNHTYDHTTLTKVSADVIQSELSRTDSAVEAAIGTPTSIMRPPGGEFNDTVCAAVGRPLVTWSIDTRDWEHRNAAKTIAAVCDHVRSGDIVLMHDRLKSTVTACRTIIPTLISRGYQLVTVDELALLRNGGMNSGTVYRSFR